MTGSGSTISNSFLQYNLPTTSRFVVAGPMTLNIHVELDIVKRSRLASRDVHECLRNQLRRRWQFQAGEQSKLVPTLRNVVYILRISSTHGEYLFSASAERHLILKGSLSNNKFIIGKVGAAEPQQQKTSAKPAAIGGRKVSTPSSLVCAFPPLTKSRLEATSLLSSYINTTITTTATTALSQSLTLGSTGTPPLFVLLPSHPRSGECACQAPRTWRRSVANWSLLGTERVERLAC